MTFNGEIYNFQDLRKEIAETGYRFRGGSDTEVLLSAVAEWGLPHALERFVGMFAFALWDSKAQALFIARDRFGEKPVYYGWVDHLFLFGSELKAIVAAVEGDLEIDRDALALYFHGGFIPGPCSIYRGIQKLEPASFVALNLQTMTPGLLPKPQLYWSLRSAASRSGTFEGSAEEACDQLDILLRRSIADQMIADVPLGAFLSGGVDSSMIVAAMQAQSTRAVRTFTIGFEEKTYDESAYAEAVAKHLKTDHTAIRVTPQEALSVVERLPRIYDEPFSDSSQIPTLLVSQLARRHVTVSLSGDGGDELFGGYPRYTLAKRLWSKLRLLPGPIRKAMARTIRRVPVSAWNVTLNGFLKAVGKSEFLEATGDRVHKAAELLDLDSDARLYWTLMSHWKHPEKLVLGARTVRLENAFLASESKLASYLDRMCYADTVCYLPDDILVKVDRASMAVSLESRVPFLDHRVVEFAWTLPEAMKSASGRGKLLLKKLLCRYVPRELVERPKMGFAVPIDRWLRSSLRDWAEELLSPRRLAQEGYLDVKEVRAKWCEHLTGKRRWHYYIWDVLMFQAWLEAQRQPAQIREAA